MKTGLKFLAATLFCLAPISSYAEPALDKAAVEKIVREYLLENPEIMLEVQEALGRKQAEQLAEQQTQTIRDQAALLFDSPYQIVMGNPEAKTTVVEFFDYNCGFCQRAMADMERILETDGDNVRFILKEFPVLGEASFEASQVSLAFSRILPEKYPQFHVELLGLEGLKDREAALQLAESMGANRDQVVAEMENPEILQAIRDVYEVANGLGITGTPSYVTGNEVVFGAVGYAQLKETLENTGN